jgi:PAS domain S-box-containing protein
MRISPWRWLLRVLATALAYWIAGKLALLMAIPPGYATSVWPAAGFALSALLVWGNRAAPGVALGSFCVNVGTAFDSSSTEALTRSLALALIIAVGAMLQALVGAELIRRCVGFPTALEDEPSITRFTVLGGPVACLINPTISVTTLWLFGLLPWANVAFSWWTWWVGDAIGVLLFAPLSLVFVQSPGRRRGRAAVALPLLGSFAVVTALFVQASSWEADRVRADFERRAVYLAHALESTLSEHQQAVSFVASLFYASDEVTRGEFREFAGRALNRYDGIQALGWIPLVGDAERASYEQRARDDGLSAFHFTEYQFSEPGASGELALAARRPEYLPAYYLEPSDGNAAALGFDNESDPARAEAISRARDTGNPSATPPLALDGRGPDEHAVMLFVPVFDVPRGVETGGPAKLEGYAAGVFRMHDMVEAALAPFDRSGVELALVEESASTGGHVLYRSNPGAAATNDDGAATTPGPRAWSDALLFGGRRYRLEVTANRASLAVQQSWQAWLVLGVGLLFARIMGVVTLMTTGRASRAQRSLEEAQRAALAEEKFRSAIEAAPTGMVLVDRQGVMILVNRQVESLFGYARSELVGRSAALLLAERLRPRAAEIFRPPPDELEDAAPPSSSFGAEFFGQHADGSELPIELGLNPMTTPDGELVLISILDITERKRAERDKEALLAELRTLNLGLEERVKTRTGQLSAMLKERDVLLQEIHHRVKNNLQVISSLINMQVRRLSRGKNRDALSDCQTRVQVIALIHETLYQSRDYAQIPFSEYAKNLSHNVFHAGAQPHGVALELDIADVSLAVDKAIPCGLILNELISNALKHAFPEGREGTVRVVLSPRERGRLTLAVTDDGVGIPSDLDVLQSGQLGLQLVRTLAGQLDAELCVQRGAGTSFELSFAAEA